MATIGQICRRLITSSRFSESALLIRTSAGSYTENGIFIEGATETLNIFITHQPATDDDRQELEIGERLRDVRTVWIKTYDKNEARPVRFGDKISKGDIIQIKTINYRVMSVDNYSVFGHIKALCTRDENQSD